MAYYVDEENQQVGQGPEEGANKAGSSVVSGSGQAPGAAGAAAPAETAKATSHSGGASPFVGINEYLNANKQQSQKLGNQVGGYVGGKIDSAGQKLEGANKAFGENIDKNTNIYDQNLASEISSNPNAVASDQNKVNKIRSIQKGYQGPTDINADSAFQEARQNALKAQTYAGQLGNSQGQTNILQNMQSDTRGGKISKGASVLDQGLLQASPEARAGIVGAKEKGAAVSGNIDKIVADALQKAQGAQGTSSAAQQQLSKLFSDQFGAQQGTLNAKAAAANKQAQDTANALKAKAIQNAGSLTDQELKMLGVGSKEGLAETLMKLKQYGQPQQGFASGGDVGLEQYFNMTKPGANIQNVASAEDYARNAALSQLAGGGQFLNDPSQAGTFNADTIDFDLGGANKTINEYEANLVKQKEQAAAAAAAAAAGAQGSSKKAKGLF